MECEETRVNLSRKHKRKITIIEYCHIWTRLYFLSYVSVNPSPTKLTGSMPVCSNNLDNISKYRILLFPRLDYHHVLLIHFNLTLLCQSLEQLEYASITSTGPVLFSLDDKRILITTLISGYAL